VLPERPPCRNTGTPRVPLGCDADLADDHRASRSLEARNLQRDELGFAPGQRVRGVRGGRQVDRRTHVQDTHAAGSDERHGEFQGHRRIREGARNGGRESLAQRRVATGILRPGSYDVGAAGSRRPEAECRYGSVEEVCAPALGLEEDDLSRADGCSGARPNRRFA
jgi:hypothetical protein